MRECENMATETKTQTDLNEPDWAKFEKSGVGGDFLKFKDNETHIVGVQAVKEGTGKFMRKQPDGTEKETEVPQILLVLDFVDKPLATPQIFGTSAKYLISMIRKYHESKMLYKWHFEVQRKGVGKETKYTIIPTRERTNVGHPSNAEQAGAFV